MRVVTCRLYGRPNIPKGGSLQPCARSTAKIWARLPAEPEIRLSGASPICVPAAGLKGLAAPSLFPCGPFSVSAAALLRHYPSNQTLLTHNNSCNSIWCWWLIFSPGHEVDLSGMSRPISPSAFRNAGEKAAALFPGVEDMGKRSPAKVGSLPACSSMIVVSFWPAIP